MQILTSKHDVVLDVDGLIYGAVYVERTTETDDTDELQSDFVNIKLERITNRNQDAAESFALNLTPSAAKRLGEILVKVASTPDADATELPFTD